MRDLQQLLENVKKTENGDISFQSLDDKMLDILFKAEYYTHHLEDVPDLTVSELSGVFAMFMRDPRNGLGWKDLGRHLMKKIGIPYEYIAFAGRYDDIWKMYLNNKFAQQFLKKECAKGNELCKKWMPRYSSKNLMAARTLAKAWGMNKQQYGHFIKCNTTEQHLSRKNYDDIKFEQVPSLASIKYAHTFSTKEELKDRYAEYLEDVKNGKKKLNIATTTPYDIYKNRTAIDADLFFDKLEKISGNWIPIVDTSGSMQNSYDALGKALSIGHYLAKCSTYAPNQVISFSSYPSILKLGEENTYYDHYNYRDNMRTQSLKGIEGQYNREIQSMITGDCSNTDFGAVMEKLQALKNDAPEYLVVLSDMEFDMGSSMSKDTTMKMFKDNRFNTKIIWWNFNDRNQTCPETDEYGNIFMSGYSPMLLKYLESGFDGKQFLDKLLKEYVCHMQTVSHKV